ncbi:hypothetical protein F8M41_003550 [Gigaspora margarita]|uniref:Uncharacterized protein n=1 Tax=Gigaspora margarita TaxID=4874 RepID=A0A8H4AY34_GIGMA|nr:hypothetical protein F8M41_003550 [Gigaspora margarita]
MNICQKNFFYYCEKCNTFQQFKICLSCENKLYFPDDFDTQSQLSTILSEIDQLNRELQNDQLELKHNQSLQSHETNHQIKIIDLPHKDKHEVIAKMNKWEHVVRNDTCGELINNFGYISNQNGYVINLDDKVYFSDNNLKMDSDFNSD